MIRLYWLGWLPSPDIRRDTARRAGMVEISLFIIVWTDQERLLRPSQFTCGELRTFPSSKFVQFVKVELGSLYAD
jgi:hypothetical protein